jgi:hypothetical protein
MEALQLLKFALKKEHLNFMNGWSTSEVAMNEEGVSGLKLVALNLGSLFVGNPDAVMDNMLNNFSTYHCNC